MTTTELESQPARPNRSVTRFEYELLQLLRFLLGQLDPQQGLQLLAKTREAPKQLTHDCVHLVKDHLAKGLILYLTRSGGWRNEKFLEKGNPTGGRIWERVQLDERKLVFSEAPLSFLIWLTAHNPVDQKTKPPAWHVNGELTVADHLFFALAAEVMRTDAELRILLRTKEVFSANPLAWLFHPEDYAANTTAPPSFQSLFAGTGAAILECLQPRLMKHWLISERTKSQVTDWTVMAVRGVAELALFSKFLSEAEQANRKDLARFLLRCLTELFRDHTPDASFWIGGMTVKQPNRLADRLAIQRGALAIVQQADVFAKWDRVSRSVGYFDEEYQASQLLKEDYEAAAVADFAAKAKRVLDQVEPLKV